MDSGKGPGTVRIEPSPKRVRAYLAQELVADTTRPLLVWEVPYYPSYYLPVADVRARLVPTGSLEHSAGQGDAELYDVQVGGNTAAGAAKRYTRSPVPELREAVHITWQAMDEWLEEDEPVYTHPRDPHTRVDILASSRHVEVKVGGAVVADSRQPRILFETGLPPRYYLPLADFRMDLLVPSGTRSHCPYKGTAEYWHLEIGGRQYDDLVWMYRAPLPESQKIAGLAAVYNEKVELYLDGVAQPRPRTHFS